MRKLSIAYGNSCFAKTWANKEITFEELCERLKTTIRTSETIEEYPKLPKEGRNRIKDIGGFVGGKLKDNSRKGENVICRSMLTLDVDEAKVGFIEEFISKFDKAFCLYSTHRHKPDAPRVRVIVPLTKDVTPDEYTAITRYFAYEWGIDQFDECSYKPAQLMYWPTTSSNGEYVYECKQEKWLDPEEFLSKYPNWKDCSLYPTSSRESIIKNKKGRKQKDPLEKEGLVGAFCRAYTITDVMEKYLSDVYETAAVDNRYSFIGSQSSAGVVIYDDKFAYSHHAKDPACGKLLNAFDLVRIHMFGDEADSVKQMTKFISDDKQVKIELIKERQESALIDFESTSDDDKNDWMKHLTFTKDGKIRDTSTNLLLILENDERFKNIAKNTLANRIEVIGEVPWDRTGEDKFWRDPDEDQLKIILDRDYTEFSTRNYDTAFGKVVDDRRFNPVKVYLNSLPKWDGIKRVERLFIDNLEADDNDYVKAVTTKTFVAAVARIYEQGVKFDSLPVLDGAQGIGKSSIIKDILPGNYFTDSLTLTDMSDKTAAEKLQGYWIVEIGELAGMKKADIEKVKSFLSSSNDNYRATYGKTAESHWRRCIMIATVNGERGYLRDITGNRRFWIIKCRKTEQSKTWDFTDQYKQQFWAEAKELYEKGTKLYLEKDLLKEAESMQIKAMEQDERLGAIEVYLDTLLPENWDKMNEYERRSFLAKDDITEIKGTVRRTTVSNVEIYVECLGKKLADMKPSDSYQIAAMMMQIEGWTKTNQIKKIPLYGRQRLYVRK